MNWKRKSISSHRLPIWRKWFRIKIKK